VSQAGCVLLVDTPTELLLPRLAAVAVAVTRCQIPSESEGGVKKAGDFFVWWGGRGVSQLAARNMVGVPRPAGGALDACRGRRGVGSSAVPLVVENEQDQAGQAGHG
jgi:hypothetical protein